MRQRSAAERIRLVERILASVDGQPDDDATDAWAKEIERRRQENVALAMLADSPGRWPAFDAWHRLLRLRRFPYVVVFREWRGRIWVVAVAHVHRRPGSWQQRDVTVC